MVLKLSPEAVGVISVMSSEMRDEIQKEPVKPGSIGDRLRQQCFAYLDEIDAAIAAARAKKGAR